MNVEAGRLRHRVRIEQLQPLLDSNGDPIQDPATGDLAQDWAPVATVWAAIEPLSAREFIQSAATQSEVTTRVTIRYRDGLDPAMRLVHVRKGRPDVVYNSRGFLPDLFSGLEYMTIPCGAGVGQGQ